jgi:HD superfamily phosphohydrolase
VSAILVLEQFKDAIEEVGREMSTKCITVNIDPVLVARMITGWGFYIKIHENHPDEQRFENCLIRLLNGRTIDVDKLDYIIRDTWASGCDNTAIDTQRLLNSVSVGHLDSGLELAFEKSALSVIQSVVTARNYLYRWIYSHHKVIYDQWLLVTAVKALHSEFGYDQEDGFLRDVFSVEALVGSKTIDDRVFSLVADGDIMHYLKKWASKNPNSEAAEWLYRKHSRRALWKSYAEYCLLFPRVATERADKNEDFSKLFKKLLSQWERENDINLGFEILPVYPKQVNIDSGSVYVNMPSGAISYSDIEKGSGRETISIPKFFYVYIKKEHTVYSDSILEFVKNST